MQIDVQYQQVPSASAVAEWLTRSASVTLQSGTLALFEFNLHDYKTTPSWLNKDHWAHPDNWDKFRW